MRILKQSSRSLKGTAHRKSRPRNKILAVGTLINVVLLKYYKTKKSLLSRKSIGEEWVKLH